jgi:alpha-L-rhamnosidase
MTLYDLRVEPRAEPLGLDEKRPRFSWKIASEKENAGNNISGNNI